MAVEEYRCRRSPTDGTLPSRCCWCVCVCLRVRPVLCVCLLATHIDRSTPDDFVWSASVRTWRTQQQQHKQHNTTKGGGEDKHTQGTRGISMTEQMNREKNRNFCPKTSLIQLTIALRTFPFSELRLLPLYVPPCLCFVVVLLCVCE